MATKKKKTAKPAKKAAAPKKSAKKTAAKGKSAKSAKPAKAAKSAKTAAPAKAAKPEPKKNIPTPPKKPMLLTPKNTSSKQYTQSELFENIKGYCGFMTRSEAKEFYGQFVDYLQSALKSGYKVVLPGLGKIQVRKTKARMGRNPATQQPMMIPARKKVAFTALKALKESVL